MTVTSGQTSTTTNYILDGQNVAQEWVRCFQIYGFLLEAGGDDATFFVNKEGKGFGWAVNGTARAFVHVFQLHGKGWHIDFQFDGERIFQEFL